MPAAYQGVLRPMNEPTINALVSPEGSLEILSNHEVNRLKDRSEGGRTARQTSRRTVLAGRGFRAYPEKREITL